MTIPGCSRSGTRGRGATAKGRSPRLGAGGARPAATDGGRGAVFPGAGVARRPRAGGAVPDCGEPGDGIRHGHARDDAACARSVGAVRDAGRRERARRGHGLGARCHVPLQRFERKLRRLVHARAECHPRVHRNPRRRRRRGTCAPLRHQEKPLPGLHRLQQVVRRLHPVAAIFLLPPPRPRVPLRQHPGIVIATCWCSVPRSAQSQKWPQDKANDWYARRPSAGGKQLHSGLRRKSAGNVAGRHLRLWTASTWNSSGRRILGHEHQKHRPSTTSCGSRTRAGIESRYTITNRYAKLPGKEKVPRMKATTAKNSER